MSSGTSAVSSDEIHDVACPIGRIMDRVGGKWSVQVILSALQGPVRYSELERRIAGISRRMLTLTLRNLERDGLLVRKVYPTTPPRVEYTATDIARELRFPLTELAEWAKRSLPTISEAQADYDRTHDGLPG